MDLPLLRRSFNSALIVQEDTTGDGLTVVGRVVPYNEISKPNQDAPGAPVYRERFIRGALAGMNGYLHRVKLAMEHDSPGYVNTVGKAIGLDERDDGAWVTFRLYEREAERARDHLQSTHDGLSLEFYALSSWRASDGVLERRRVKVHRVAAVPEAAYRTAKVLALRGQAQPTDPEPDQPDDPNAPQEPLQPAERTRLDEALAIRAQLMRDAPRIAGRQS